MASERSRGLPIFHDDMTFRDRHERAFQEMQRRFEDDFGRRGFGRSFNDPWNWMDDLDRMSTDFYKLKPSRSRLGNVEDFGSRDSLDDDSSTTSTNLYVEHPQTKSRTFHMSFDVKDYNPGDITVKTDGDNLIITARHEDDVGGHKNVREFSRKIKIPKDVDSDKLTSTLSHDGILTVHAPVPPKYTSVAYVNPTVPATTTSTSVGGATSAASTAASGTQHQKPTLAEQTQSHPMKNSSGQNQMTPAPTIEPTAASRPSYVNSAPSKQQQQQQQQQQPQQQPQQQEQPVVEPPPLFEHTGFSQLPLDTPTFRDCPDGSGREFQLAIEVPRPFTPDDVVVKLEGKSLKVEASHEERSQGKSSTSSMNRSFEISEDLDAGSVEAMLRSDGCLLIKGKAKRNT
ncbi:hypothetical protein LSH36_297g03052 [Paralvinella palmiformis]|uniref:SHSP domain-containing protein n=1 Tax=Paralvinella palmiformis TaxID=53620 RepID=A0AAD9JIQ8_9ANNE|nr:hypothetical protein LSH36_297g03052 [Paralvinella palmiformis]